MERVFDDRLSSTKVSEPVWLNVGVIGLARELPLLEVRLGEWLRIADKGRSGTGGGDWARAARAAPGVARGVAIPRPPMDLRGVASPRPGTEGRELAFGVACVKVIARVGERVPVRVGLIDRWGVDAPRETERSLAVSPTYLLAREPGANLGASGVLKMLLPGRARYDCRGLKDGVSRPDATESDRLLNAVNFVGLTKTPQLGAHVKYRTLYPRSTMKWGNWIQHASVELTR